MSIHKTTIEELTSLSKRRGFIFAGSEIYGGLAGTWDYGPLGVKLKENIKTLFRNHFINERSDMYEMDGSILGAGEVYRASGHTAGFNDPLVPDIKTGERFRADHLLEEAGVTSASNLSMEEMTEKIKELGLQSPAGNSLGEVRQFNLMFDVYPGAIKNEETVAYLRPETAQSIFINFKNILDSMSPKLPFGIAQIGKAYRNEIAPRNFIFRLRELEQMEIEYFVREENWEECFEEWRMLLLSFAKRLGLSDKSIVEREQSLEERAHYSKRTIDIEFSYPFGVKELWGLAYRGEYDLSKHMKESGERLQYLDLEHGNQWITPHVIEPSLGVERTLLAVLTDAYDEDEIGGEKRTVLRFSPEIAPYRVAVFPLLKNKPELVEKAREVYASLAQKYPGRVAFDTNGNIGKRYRRQDEIGTPVCVTIDFETLEGDEEGVKETVTIRDRDTAEQKRISIEDLTKILN